jgi:Leucine-rich repeat (LRR) protein
LIKYFRTLGKIFTKNSSILITTLILACNAEKEFLMENNLDENQITVNGKATKEENVFNQLYQNQTALYYWAFV